MSEKIFEIAVIGGGAAGQMGVLRSVLNNRNTLLIKGDGSTTRKSRGTWVHKVVNMPFVFETKRPIATGTKGTLDWIHSEENFKDKLTVVNDAAENLEKLENGNFKITTVKGECFEARFVLLTTGIMDKQPEINGSIEPVLPYANSGFIDYCIRCDGHKAIGKVTATIGHKSSAAWVATMLHERYQPPEMKIFTNGKEPEFSEEVSKIVKAYGIEVITEAITEIVGDPKEKLEAFKLANGKEEKLDLAFVVMGQIAYNQLAKQVGADLHDKGNVICNDKGESSTEGLYVAGDLRDTGKYQIYTAWDQAVDSIDDMDAKLREEFRLAKLK